MAHFVQVVVLFIQFEVELEVERAAAAVPAAPPAEQR